MYTYIYIYIYIYWRPSTEKVHVLKKCILWLLGLVRAQYTVSSQARFGDFGGVTHKQPRGGGNPGLQLHIQHEYSDNMWQLDMTHSSSKLFNQNQE